MIGIDRARVKLLKAVIIAVKLVDVDRKGVVAFYDRVSRADLFQTFVHRRDQRLKIALLIFVVGLVLKKRRGDFSCRAGTSAAMNQIGENLL